MAILWDLFKPLAKCGGHTWKTLIAIGKTFIVANGQILKVICPSGHTAAD